MAPIREGAEASLQISHTCRQIRLLPFSKRLGKEALEGSVNPFNVTGKEALSSPAYGGGGGPQLLRTHIRKRNNSKKKNTKNPQLVQVISQLYVRVPLGC